MEKVLLLILDGFGINRSEYGNAIAAANKPNYDKFISENSNSELIASGKEVGLSEGDMGNSEVGHLNIGAGRIVYQLNTMILKEIREGTFFKNEKLLEAVEHAKKNKSDLHLLGVLSNGNVHSNINHIWALLKLCKKEGLKQVYFHAFMDGRDTLPHSGIELMEQFLTKTKKIGIGKVATISGRYYAMDRDFRWNRIEKAYDVIVNGKGEKITDPLKAIKKSYDSDITDEFIIPKIMIENGKPVATLKDNDAVISFNFRGDRMRQLTRSLKVPEFNKFPVRSFRNLKYVCFNEYDIKFTPYVEVAFKRPQLINILGEVIAAEGLKQLRLAETEKYAHVTFFFNGGVEIPFKNEERILVDSPRIPTYDMQPEMSAYEIKSDLLYVLNSKRYDLIVVNFANCDMVGHTGVFDATVKAVEAVDSCLAEVLPTAKQQGYNIILIADHGNAEKMLNENGKKLTSHSTNPVPCIISLENQKKSELHNGVLADVAPTILHIMGIDKPKEMKGNCLICRK